jgi:hypothetical protein
MADMGWSVILSSRDILRNPANIDFGEVEVGNSLQKSVTITNSATVPLVILFAITPDVFSLPNNETTITIQPGKSYDLTVQFSPYDFRNRIGSLIFTHNFNVSEVLPVTIPLRGVSITPVIVIFPKSIDFGEINTGSSSQKNVGIKNNGSKPLVISSFDIDGSAFRLPNNETTITIQPGNSYDLAVQFLPTADIDYTGSIMLIDNANGSRNHISLRGKGVGQTISVDELGEIPTAYSLMQNYPNPFNPTTKIQYSLPEVSYVRLSVYNGMGQEMMQLVNENQSAGKYIVEFNAQSLPSGIYFYRLQNSKFVDTKKMLLLK